ncbi:MAG TPA: APC family permease [Acidobacteriaceae bacterium]|nr:APC family permease [Acidobacteriaceae bacterium]
MADTPADEATSGIPHLRRVLSLWDLVVFGIIAVTPSAPITVFGLASVRARGHTVDTILFAMVATVLTAISYGRMAALYPSAGSAYTYVGRGLNPQLGFVAGWAMLLDYLTIPLFCVVYGSLIVQRMLPEVPYVIIAAGFASGTTYLNVRGIRTTARTNQVLLLFMGVVLLAFIALAIRYLLGHEGWPGLFSSAPFYDPREFHLGTVIHATSFAALTYIGFDSVTTLAEDVRNPKRNVLLSLVIVCLFTGIFGGLLTYLGQRIWPDFRTFPDVATAFMDAARRAGGMWLFEAMILVLAVANVGAGLTGQVGAARLLFALGRENVLPKRFFAHLSPKTNTPSFNIALIGALTFAGSLGKRYDLIGELQNFGAFLGFMGVNLATIRQFYFLPLAGRRRSFWKDFLLPGLGFVICTIIWLGLTMETKIVGGVWFVAGLTYAAVRTRGFRQKPVLIDFTES